MRKVEARDRHPSVDELADLLLCLSRRPQRADDLRLPSRRWVGVAVAGGWRRARGVAGSVLTLVIRGAEEKAAVAGAPLVGVGAAAAALPLSRTTVEVKLLRAMIMAPHVTLAKISFRVAVRNLYWRRAKGAGEPTLVASAAAGTVDRRNSSSQVPSWQVYVRRRPPPARARSP